VGVRLLDLLPRSHLVYLRHVMCVLHQIAAHSHINNMTARNLSVCVSQNLLWPPRRHGASEMLNDVSRVSQVCHRLIESAAKVFGPHCLELFGGPRAGPGPSTADHAVTTDDDSDNVGTLSHILTVLFFHCKRLQRLSYVVRLEDKWKIIRNVFCYVV